MRIFAAQRYSRFHSVFRKGQHRILRSVRQSLTAPLSSEAADIGFGNFAVVEHCCARIDPRRRKALCLVADTSISGAKVARELDALVSFYGKPKSIVSDNGTESTSRAIPKWANDHDIDWHHIDHGKPWLLTYAAEYRPFNEFVVLAEVQMSCTLSL